MILFNDSFFLSLKGSWTSFHARTVAYDILCVVSSQVDTVPALIQNEIHPYYQENDVIPFIQEKGIVVQGWYPLGGRGHTGELLGDSVISEIAGTHGVSSAQVILRWNL